VNLHIVYTASKSWVGRLIRWATKQRVSHTAFVNTEDGRRYVYEAGWLKFVRTPYEKWSKTRTIVAAPPLVQSIDAAEPLVRSWVNVPYDYPALFGMAWVAIGRWLKKKWHNPLNSARALICSESGAVALQYARYPRADRLCPESTTPGDLLRFQQEVATGRPVIAPGYYDAA
jgi:hypothetical protein